MATIRKVKVTRLPLGEIEESHIFETCSRCKQEIDNSINGFYGHKNHPGLILCLNCYQELVSKGKWSATKLAVADLVKEVA